MKLSRLYLLPALALAAMSVVGCSDKFDNPPMIIPSQIDIPEENLISIYDLKKQYWDDARNYIDTIGLAANDDSLYVKARVISSDESGNIYNCIYIQDGTAALPISVRYPDMYTKFRIGQEVVLNVSDMFIGKFNGLQQLGQPNYGDYGWEASFMAKEFFESHIRISGMPDIAQIDTITINSISELPKQTDDMIRMQGQLVRINNVYFEDADGVATFAGEQENTNRNIVDADGNTLTVRNSGYADFRGKTLPMGTGDIVGILGFYGENWQIVLRDEYDCIGFTTDTNGTEINPYTIEQAIELQGSASGWVTGYIVGAVAPEVTTVTSDADIEWAAPTTLGNTIVIGMTADTRSFAQCIVMELPQGSALQNTVNLAEHPEALGTQIWVKGKLENYMGTYGLTGNSGSAGEFKTTVVSGGVTSLYEDFESGNIPAGWANIIVSGNKDWYTDTFNNDTYAIVTGHKGSNPPFEAWLISPALDLENASQKVFSFDNQQAGYGGGDDLLEVYILSTNDPATATRIANVTDQANWAHSTTGSYSGWTASGDIDISQYSNHGTIFIGFRYYAEASDKYDNWCIDDFRFGTSGGTTPDPGPGGDDTPISATRADFETLGTPSGYYTTPFTSSDGWKTTFCSLLAGSDDPSASSPYFQFIGYVTGSTTEFAYAPCMNGRTTQTGTIVSPTITGGCGELTFNFGIPFSESDPIGFRVDIKQNGSVVKTFNVEGTYPKGVAQSHSETINVSGNFTIEFVNLSPSQLDENKNRVCIWNVSWTNY